MRQRKWGTTRKQTCRPKQTSIENSWLCRIGVFLVAQTLVTEIKPAGQTWRFTYFQSWNPKGKNGLKDIQISEKVLIWKRAVTMIDWVSWVSPPGAAEGNEKWGVKERAVMASAGARGYNGSLGAKPPAGSRGRAPGQGVRSWKAFCF